MSLHLFLIYLDVGDVQLGGGGDNVSLVDATERDAVELEGTSDEQKTAVKLLQEDDALAAVATSQEDKNGTGGDALAKSSLLGRLAGDLGLRNILSGVEARSLGGRNGTLATVLGTLHFNNLVGLDFSRLGRSNGNLLFLVQELLVVHSRAAEASDAGNKETVAGGVSHFFEYTPLKKKKGIG